ncbi:MAG: hypothetical protein J0I12_07365 [Candidatus Eremiobacteraeota bacterium]|nr:hypothetical protein [Candidatus Eremiobacteraeota bacterium]
MKSLWTYLGLALILTGCSGSPKHIVDSGEIGAISFRDEKHGWAVGHTFDKKLFLASTEDGGGHWKLTQVDAGGQDGSLFGIAFRDEKNGWAVGSHRLAFSTSDGGQNWTKMEALGDAKALHYKASTGCLVLGSTGFAHTHGILVFEEDPLKSTGGGSQSDRGRIIDPWDVQIVDGENLIGFDSTTLYRSSDKGKSWKVIELNESLQNSSVVNAVNRVYFDTPEHGWLAYDDGTLSTTNDGGITRTPLNALGLEGRKIWRLHFFDSTTGVALTRAENGKQFILTTLDGGKSWKNKLTLDEGEWDRWDVVDKTHAWVGGRIQGKVYVKAFKPG